MEISYEKIYNLYIVENLSVKEVMERLKISKATFGKLVKKFNIVKSQDLKNKVRERTNLKLYGVKSKSMLPEVKEKFKQSCLEKYGVDNPNKSREVREKIEKTNLEKYGNKVASKSDMVKNNVKERCVEKYGVESVNSLNSKIEKCKQTNLSKYGVTCSLHSNEIKNKIKEQNIEKYGVECHLSAKEIIEKRKQTNISKWGTDNPSTAHLGKEIIELINNKDKLETYIRENNIKTITQLSNSIDSLSYEGAKLKVHQLGLFDILDHFTSTPELELQELFPTFYKTKKIIHPYEIDLYNEEYKLGIEFNGSYWHSEVHKDSLYHQNKSCLGESKGVFIYNIFEYEWNNPQTKNIIISQINNLMGKNNKIYARKCNVKEVSYKESAAFLDKNHIQGKDTSSIRLGLYYDNELVSIMTFCKPRFNKKYNWELSRFCSKLNTSIIGGASKLFKHFIKSHKNESIISYCDIGKGQGNIYHTLGFKFSHISKPNYVWYNNGEILSRYQCQKHKLKEFFDLGNTETEIMTNRGYSRIYDCGNKVFIYNP